jgi:hypothetical protein
VTDICPFLLTNALLMAAEQVAIPLAMVTVALLVPLSKRAAAGVRMATDKRGV